ncbi:hypothetical protein ACWNXI_02575 [Caldibacillus thermoamylovorans]
MNYEELVSRLVHMKNAIISLHEYLAPELKTRDLAILKYGFTEKQISELDNYFKEIVFNNVRPSKEDFRKKLAEIKNLPDLTDEVLEDVLLGYKSDGMYVNIIDEILKK